MTMKEVMLKRMTRGSSSDNIGKWMMVMVMLVKHSDNIDRSYQVPSFSAASQQAELERDQKRWREGGDRPHQFGSTTCVVFVVVVVLGQQNIEGIVHIWLFEQFELNLDLESQNKIDSNIK